MVNVEFAKDITVPDKQYLKTGAQYLSLFFYIYCKYIGISRTVK